MKGAVAGVTEKVPEGAQHLSDEVKSFMIGTIEELKGQISFSLEGRDEFVANGCESFRSSLIDVMSGADAVAKRVQELVTFPAPTWSRSSISKTRSRGSSGVRVGCSTLTCPQYWYHGICESTDEYRGWIDRSRFDAFRCWRPVF